MRRELVDGITERRDEWLTYLYGQAAHGLARLDLVVAELEATVKNLAEIDRVRQTVEAPTPGAFRRIDDRGQRGRGDAAGAKAGRCHTGRARAARGECEQGEGVSERLSHLDERPGPRAFAILAVARELSKLRDAVTDVANRLNGPDGSEAGRSLYYIADALKEIALKP